MSRAMLISCLSSATFRLFNLLTEMCNIHRIFFLLSHTQVDLWWFCLFRNQKSNHCTLFIKLTFSREHVVVRTIIKIIFTKNYIDTATENRSQGCANLPFWKYLLTTMNHFFSTAVCLFKMLIGLAMLRWGIVCRKNYWYLSNTQQNFL